MVTRHSAPGAAFGVPARPPAHSECVAVGGLRGALGNLSMPHPFASQSVAALECVAVGGLRRALGNLR